MRRLVRVARAVMVLCVMLGTGGWLALGAVPASADLSPTLFDYQGFAPSAGPALNLEGVASASSSAVQLVSDDDEGSVAGAAWYPNQVDVESDWVSQFNFQVPASGSDPEGFAFVIQGASPAELGEPGPGLGYTGISDSLAIEFGLTSNAQYEEPPAPFLSVQTNGTGSNAPYPQYTLGAESAASPGSQTSVLGDGQQLFTGHLPVAVQWREYLRSHRRQFAGVECFSFQLGQLHGGHHQ